MCVPPPPSQMPAKRDARAAIPAPLAPSRSTREWWFISTRVLYNYLRRRGEDDDAADDAAALQEGIIRESWSASPRSAFKGRSSRRERKKTVWKLFNLKENFVEAKERGEFEKKQTKKKKKEPISFFSIIRFENSRSFLLRSMIWWLTGHKKEREREKDR